MRRLFGLFACAVALSAAGLEFEVASVKPSAGFAGPVGPAAGGEARGRGRMYVQLGTNEGGRFVAQGIPLRALILLAYEMQDFQLTGGAEEILRQRFDIEAKPEAGTNPTREQSLEMLRALLAERFDLKVRRETKQGPTFALVMAKAGVLNKAGLKRSDDQSALPVEEDGRIDLRDLMGRPAGGPGRGGFGAGGGPAGAGQAGLGGAGSQGPGGPGDGFGGRGGRGGQAAGGPAGRGPGGGGPAGPRGRTMDDLKRGEMVQGPGFLRAKAVSIDKLLGPIVNEVSKPVADKTGLAGLFDIELSWTPAEMAQMLANLPADRPLPRGLDAAGPPLVKALQDQLGLKLDQATGPVDALVIERVAKPSQN